ncbi:hypothetical protein D9M71_583000 [compost metagenome]
MDARQGTDTQAPHLLQQLQLITRIEVVGRLVEDQQLRLLNQRAGEDYPLLFTARQAGKTVVVETLQTDRLQCGFDQTAVFVVVAVEQALVRRATHGDDFLDVEAEGIRELLQDHSDTLGAPARRLPPQVVLIQTHLATLGLVEAIGTTQQAGLATAIRPDQADELSRPDLQIDRAQLELVMTMAVAQGRPVQVADTQGTHDSPGESGRVC